MTIFMRIYILTLYLSTDVHTYVYYFKCFDRQGLRNLYILKNQEDNEKMPPVHKVYANVYANYCIALLNAHLGTGADYI